MATNTLLLNLTLLACLLGLAIGQSTITFYDQIPPNETQVETYNASHPTSPPMYPVPMFFCHTGVWIIYLAGAEIPYDRNGWIVESDSCYIWGNHYWASITSAWLIESSNHPETSTINLFPNEKWGNATESTILEGDQPSYSGIFNSLVATGSKAVTFYTDVNYQGDAVCLETFLGNRVPFVYSVQDFLQLTPGSIKSFKFGCFTKNIVKAENNKMV